MRIEILPMTGAGNIRFGMHPDDVRSILGNNYESFKRTTESMFPCDFFKDLGVFVYYTAEAAVEAVEFVLPAAPLLDGINLLVIPYSEFRDRLLVVDPKLEVNENSITSYMLCVGAYCPDADEEPELPVESIIVFAKGYFDS